MATEKEIDSVYLSNYMRWLSELEVIRYKKPDLYDDMAESVRNYRHWVSTVAGIRDLPEVPEK